jgi:hypothetical protein
LAAELAAYLGASKGGEVVAGAAAEYVADETAKGTVEHYGEQYLEEHAPNLVSHEPGKPGVHNLPDLSNIPPLQPGLHK